MPSRGVHLSVTFVYSVETNKHIFKKFSTSGILVFQYQTSRQYSDGTPLTGASNAGEVGKNRDLGQSGFIVSFRVLVPLRPASCYQHCAAAVIMITVLLLLNKKIMSGVSLRTNC